MGDLSRYAVANARLRALRAGLLGVHGLDALYSYPSAAAMAEALGRTVYGNVPRQHFVTVARALAACLEAAPRELIVTYARRLEVENLQLLFRVVGSPSALAVAESMWIDLGDLATVDGESLRTAHDLRELVDRLRPSVYGPALRAALPRVEHAGAFALELAVELDFHERLWAATAGLSEQDQAIARDLIGTFADVLNITWIGHYRDCLRLSPEEILNYTLRHGRWITEAIRRALAEQPDNWLPLARTPFAALVDAVDSTALLQPWRVLSVAVRRALSGYPFHVGAPLGLLIGLDLELRDIAALQAAKRLGLGSAEAFAHLTLPAGA